MRRFITASNEERGAALLEYALIISLVALIAVSSVQAFGGAVSDTFTEAGNAIVQPELVEIPTTTTTAVIVRIRPTPKVKREPVVRNVKREPVVRRGLGVGR